MTKKLRFLSVFVLLAVLTACSSSKSSSTGFYKKNVTASYYANKFNGRKTASGERFSNSDLTAAHRKLPFGTRVRVTNVANGESVTVKINDRGPHKKSREIDLSRKAFMAITDNKNHGLIQVNIEILR